MLGIRRFDHFPMVWKLRYRLEGPLQPHDFRRLVRRRASSPVGSEAEFAIRPFETIDIMRFFEGRLQIDKALFLQFVELRQVAIGIHVVDQRALVEIKTRQMRNAETFRQFVDNENIRARIGKRLDQLRSQNHMLLSTAAIDIIMLKECRRRQDDIGHLRRIGHELFVHCNEKILARETFANQPLFRRHIHRVGVLDQHRHDGWAAIKSLTVTGENTTDLRLIEKTKTYILHGATFDLALVHLEDA